MKVVSKAKFSFKARFSWVRKLAKNGINPCKRINFNNQYEVNALIAFCDREDSRYNKDFLLSNKRLEKYRLYNQHRFF